jgi:rRNA maturation RNase YbeY
LSKFVHVYCSPGFKISKRTVHKLVKAISGEMGFIVNSLEINFVDLETIKEVNNTYMKHNYETDIVTLDYSEKIDRLDTELFISYDVAKENAKKFKVTLNEELIRLVVHGILHVTGFDDTSPAEKRKMKKVENKLTNKFNNIDLSPVIK